MTNQPTFRRPILGVLTDFGLVDDAVGLCKGLMLSICPEAQLIDVTHAVTPFDVYEGSLYLADSFRYFPAHAVFACVVFPQTGIKADSIALRTLKGQVYVGPNNGLLTRVVQDAGVAEAYRVTSPKVLQPELNPTFYGRDIVMSAAAHIAHGFPLTEVGPPIRQDEIVLLEQTQPAVNAAGDIVGEVAILDKNYGNVWTNIPQSFLADNGIHFGTNLEITVDTIKLRTPLLETFGKVGVGEPLAYISSRGSLALGLNQGNCAARYNIERGMRVQVHVLKDE